MYTGKKGNLSVEYTKLISMDKLHMSRINVRALRSPCNIVTNVTCVFVKFRVRALLTQADTTLVMNTYICLLQATLLCRLFIRADMTASASVHVRGISNCTRADDILDRIATDRSDRGKRQSARNLARPSCTSGQRRLAGWDKGVVLTDAHGAQGAHALCVFLSSSSGT